MSLLGAIGGALIGGFFKKKANDKNVEMQQQTNQANRQDFLADRDHDRAIEVADREAMFTNIVDSAQRAGINPLTALGSSASGNFGSRGGGFGGAAVAPTVSPLASADVIANAIDGVEDVLSGDAAIRKATNRANLGIAEIRLERERMGGASTVIGRTIQTQGGNARVMSPSYSRPMTPRNLRSSSEAVAPSANKLRGVVTPAGNLSFGLPVLTPKTATPTDYELDTQDLRNSNRNISTVFGNIEVDEKNDPAETFETEYGDIVTAIYGAGKLAHDAGKTARGQIKHRWGRQTRRPRLNPRHVVKPRLQLAPWLPSIGE